MPPEGPDSPDMTRDMRREEAAGERVGGAGKQHLPNCSLTNS